MRRFGVSVLIAVAATAALTSVTPASAAEASCQTDIPVVGDVDGDGQSDLIVGVPRRNSNTGEVDLRLTTAASRLLTQQAAGLGQGAAGDEFGAAVVLADLNNDGCDDMLIGAPGASNHAGRVHLILGAEDGFQDADGQTLVGAASSGDRFGSSLAIAPNLPRTGFDLWIGAPRDDVGSATDAGSVAHYSITSSGGNLSINLVQTITQNSSAVPGSAESNDQFGAALSATPRGVVVGSQLEDIGTTKDAGSITLLASIDNDAQFDKAFSWSQASSGVPGNAESGDHFGAAIGFFGEHFAAGVPDEDVRTSSTAGTNAGMVQLFRWSGTTPVPTGEFKQYTTGVPGKVESGDRFGAAVLVGRNIGCPDGIQIVAGVPGEDITFEGASRLDAGTVAFFTPPPFDPCAGSVDQANLLPRTPESNDRLGATLALGRHSDDTNAASDRAFIGVPGEDSAAGIVQSTPTDSESNSTDITVAGVPNPSVGYSGGNVAGTNYGAVIASPAGE
jgi:FG-GAP repeat